MKFLADENISIRIVLYLQKMGIDINSSIKEKIGLSDETILAKSYREERILITSDKDFGDLIFNKNLPCYGIILLRLKNQSMHNKLQIIEKIITTIENKDIAGNIIIVTEEFIRVRLLPKQKLQN